MVDADTGMLADLGSIRLIGVETPGQESIALLPRLLAGPSVRVEYVQNRTGQLRRTLACLMLPNGCAPSRERSS